jgi:membrane associated rhomboid family serine protease
MGMAGSPDLFVVCRNCRAEVSPYITECPYCGHRLRKRAPKLDKGAVPRTPKRRRRPSTPSLGRLRPGEMPGVRTDGRPLATSAIVLASIGATLAALISTSALASLIYVDVGGLSDEWWKAITTTFVYPAGDFGGTAYELVTLSVIFLFGWLLERRHGWWAPLIVWSVGAIGGTFAAIALPGDVGAILGANGGALALIGAWSVRDLRALRRGEDVDADLLGVVAITLVMALMPAAITTADPVAGVVGALAGLALGAVLARLPER